MDPAIREELERSGQARVVAILSEFDPSAARGLLSAGAGEHPVLRHFLRAGPAGLAAGPPAGPPAGLAAAGAPAGAPAGPVHLARLGVVIGSVDASGAEAIDQSDDVAEVHLPGQLELIEAVSSTPSAPSPGIAWGIAAVGVPDLWNEGLTGRGVGIAHLDTGADGTHPALAGRIVSFVEFDEQGNELPARDPYDSGKHGTHTAGTLAGSEINGLKIGIAPEAELHCARVIEYPDPLVRVLAGMNWALGQPVRVLSSSLGVKGYDPFLMTVMDRIRAGGILPIIAIGNEGLSTGHPTRSPANYPNTMAVGATDNNGNVAFFSSYGPVQDGLAKPNVVAPGTNITSCVPGGGSADLMGSSMATPHVAAIAALLFQRKPDATVDEVEHAIVSTCTPIPGADPAKFGSGLVHGPAAVGQLT